VQDGCENKCTFCVVTIARGAGRSKKLDQVIQEINDLVGFGYCEVVLCGVHLGAYGHDIGVNVSLEDLVLSVLKETDVKRLRLSSLEPWDLTPDFFKLWEDSRLLPHLHLPLQSGSDRTLRRMGRRNTSNSFNNLLQAARMTIPNLSVTTDVMVGFPGETDTDFIDSYEFIDSMKFAGLHIFPYSGRPGTAASKMPEQISVDTIRKRTRLMHEVNKKHQSQFIGSFVGRELDVLWESYRSDDDLVCWSGLTSNYLRAYAYTDGDNSLRNVITKTKMVETFRGGLLGHV
jgi:threonylcarbamoyladenosine tRNA methylthiotransferase MtaB